MTLNQELFTLGDLYVSDFIKDEQDYNNRKKYELKMLLETDTGAVRLEKMPPHSMMWGKYWYRSGTNLTMKQHLREIVEDIKTVISLKDGDTWIDIACNDGTLLSYLDKNLIRIGIDPADDSYKNESVKHADLIVQDYFSKKVYQQTKFGDKKAKVITTIAMFYDIEERDSFLKDAYDILDDDGLFVLQMSYTPLMIQQMAFDNICHEHLYYYSLFNIQNLLNRNGFNVLNCTLNDANGGSFRIFANKDKADLRKFSSQQKRDIFSFNVSSIMEYEKTLKLDESQTWLDFFNKVEILKKQTYDFIVQEKAKGKKIAGYGASTKGNTLLQYFNLDNSLIDFIAERSPYKYGLKTVGTNIPILSEQEMRSLKPDYLLILPWHFIDEFVSREKDFLDSGGKFIVPCPKFEIISR